MNFQIDIWIRESMRDIPSGAGMLEHNMVMLCAMFQLKLQADCSKSRFECYLERVCLDPWILSPHNFQPISRNS